MRFHSIHENSIPIRPIFKRVLPSVPTSSQLSLDMNVFHQDVLRIVTDVAALSYDSLFFYKCQVNSTPCGYSYGTF
jgi:hypothetical protein